MRWLMMPHTEDWIVLYKRTQVVRPIETMPLIRWTSAQHVHDLVIASHWDVHEFRNVLKIFKFRHQRKKCTWVCVHASECALGWQGTQTVCHIGGWVVNCSDLSDRQTTK